jgi:hypothetical protein
MNDGSEYITNGNEMQRYESLERWVEGMKVAADRCRELGKQVKQPMWGLIATNVDNLRIKGEAICRAKGLTRNQILASVDDFQAKRAASVDGDIQATNETSLAVN